MLEEVGNDLKFPHSKPLGDGLFELLEIKKAKIEILKLLIRDYSNN